MPFTVTIARDDGVPERTLTITAEELALWRLGHVDAIDFASWVEGAIAGKMSAVRKRARAIAQDFLQKEGVAPASVRSFSEDDILRAMIDHPKIQDRLASPTQDEAGRVRNKGG